MTMSRYHGLIFNLKIELLYSEGLIWNDSREARSSLYWILSIVTIHDNRLHPAKIPKYSPSLVVYHFCPCQPSVGLSSRDHHVPTPMHVELPATYLHDKPTKQHRHNSNLPPSCKLCQVLPCWRCRRNSSRIYQTVCLKQTFTCLVLVVNYSH